MISHKRNALIGLAAMVLSSACFCIATASAQAQDGAGRGIRLKPAATLLKREPRGVVPTLDYTAVNLGVDNLRDRLEQAQKEAQAWDAENNTLSRHLEVRQRYLEDLQKFLRQPVETSGAELPAPQVAEATASAIALPMATTSQDTLGPATSGSSWLDWLERKHLWIEAALAAAVVGLLAWALMLMARRQRPQEQLAALGPPLMAEQDTGVHDMAAFTAVGDVPGEGASINEKSVVAAFSAYDRATESLVRLLKSGSGKHQLRLMRVLSAVAKKDEFLAKAESMAASSGDEDSKRWVELIRAGSPLPKKDELSDEDKVEEEVTTAPPPVAAYPLPAAAPAVFTAGPTAAAPEPTPPKEPGFEMPDGSLDYTMYQLRQKARGSRRRVEPMPNAETPIPPFESVVPESAALPEPLPDPDTAPILDTPGIGQQKPVDLEEPTHAGIREFPLDDFGDDILSSENDAIEDTSTQRLDAYLGLSITGQDDAIEAPAGSEFELAPRDDDATDDVTRDDVTGDDVARDDVGDTAGNGSAGGPETQSKPVHRKRRRKKK